jgi:hypothetical protein
MNNKINSDSKNHKKKTITRFKLKSPFTIIKQIHVSFKKKNIYKKPSFWLTNIFFIFYVFKIVQLSMYMNQFTVVVPKGDDYNNLLTVDTKMVKNMKIDNFMNYLDELEVKKIERKEKNQLVKKDN